MSTKHTPGDTPMIHVNQIHWNGEDEWSKAMNEAGELMNKAMDETLPEEKQREYWNAFIELRQRIEMGEFSTNKATQP